MLQCQGYFGYVGNDWNIVIFYPGDFAILIYDDNGATGDAFVGEIDAVFLGHGAAGLKIR